MDWGELARVQDQIAKTEDLKQRQRANQHKILYKIELEKMIQEKKNHYKIIEEEQKRQKQLNYLTLNSMIGDSPPKVRFENMLKQSSQYNLSLGKEKKMRLMSELQEQKSILKQKYKKTQTEISQNRQKYLAEKEKKKRELALCYQAQINSQDSKKYLQKLQNKKFEELAQELQHKKFQEREQHINKIKFGYIKNPESYERVRQIYHNKQDEKLNFIKKIQNPLERRNSSHIQHKKEEKQMQTIEISKFNKNHFLEKQFKRRLQHDQELLNDKKHIIQIQNQLTEEDEKVKIRRSLQRQSLKTQLQYQINSQRQNRMKYKRMSENQSRINKPVFENQLSMFPGLSKDHKDMKKQMIIDSFLSGIKPSPNSQRILK